MIDLKKSENKTVEAGIKAIVRAQRARGGESRAGQQAAKWAAEGAVKGRCFQKPGRVFCDVRAYVSCREYDGIPQGARHETVNRGGTAGERTNTRP